jgi:hypothetical protein
MNAGNDYAKAKRQAQANANETRVPWVLNMYHDTWWISRLSTFGPATQENILAGKTEFKVFDPEPAREGEFE